MTLVSWFVQPSLPYLSPTFTCHLKPSFLLREIPEKVPKSNFTRRIGTIATIAKVLLAREAIFRVKIANGFDFNMVAPGQTLEEAEGGIKDHALALLQVKVLIESKAWKDMQKALRKSSSLLKQDIYTIIQSKPGSKRPQLRKLYSNLFNNVTRVALSKLNIIRRGVILAVSLILLATCILQDFGASGELIHPNLLDYAARDNDTTQVWETRKPLTFGAAMPGHKQTSTLTVPQSPVGSHAVDGCILKSGPVQSFGYENVSSARGSLKGKKNIERVLVGEWWVAHQIAGQTPDYSDAVHPSYGIKWADGQMGG